MVVEGAALSPHISMDGAFNSPLALYVTFACRVNSALRFKKNVARLIGVSEQSVVCDSVCACALRWAGAVTWADPSAAPYAA